MSILTLAAKDLRLLLRDTRSTVILLVMPVLAVVVLGLAVGEGFGQKPDDRLRVSVVIEDAGLSDKVPFPTKTWSQIFLDDISQTAEIRIEIIADRPTAEALIRDGKRSAILAFEPDFSERVQRCSFLSEKKQAKPLPINPLFRDGIDLSKVGLTVLRDPTQQAASSIIEQVAQVSMMRIVIPWMIGQAFDSLGKAFFPLNVDKMISDYFDQYNFKAKTWEGLMKSTTSKQLNESSLSKYAASEGNGLLKRGAVRYQILVPSYTVMFAFFLVLTLGWLFVGERRQGTLVRLQAAPLSKFEILMGKLIPCLAMSVFQGVFLLVAGKLVFGMSWGPQPAWLLLMVFSTSVAAIGLAMLVASVAKTESQVAVYGTLVVLLLGALSGSLMPRDLMPEEMRRMSYVTPHAWALDGYQQLLINPEPNIDIVLRSCAVLVGFGLFFLAVAWWRIDLEP